MVQHRRPQPRSGAGGDPDARDEADGPDGREIGLECCLGSSASFEVALHRVGDAPVGKTLCVLDGGQARGDTDVPSVGPSPGQLDRTRRNSHPQRSTHERIASR